MSENIIVGKRIPSLEAYEKVTGEALYALDVHLPGMLVGKILRSPLPHAKILHIDTDKAKRIWGVKAVITANDTPKIKFGMGPPHADKLPLEDQKVRYIGDEVAAVAAVDEYSAMEALDAIRVEWEELPPVFDPIEAMDPQSPKIHDHVVNNISVFSDLHCGDVEAGFREADLVLEEEFSTPAQSHCCLEVHNVVARWEPSDRFTVWASNQSPHALKTRLAGVCNLPPSHFRILKPNLGGSFGSKANMVAMDPIALFLAQKTGCPVKIENSREEEFYAVPPRHPTKSRLRFGFTKDGKITAKQARVIMDNGAYNSTGPSILAYSCTMFCAMYRVPNVKYQGYLVYTNKVGNASFRGFGVPQAFFGHEVMMDMAADRLGIDPKDLRLINANLPDEVTSNKVRITSCGLTETIQRAAQKTNWENKRKKKTPGRGIGMASMIYTGAASNLFGGNQSGAFMQMDSDGTISLSTGAADIGQGSNTILLQMAAEVLAISPAEIRLIQGDTDITPTDIGTKGSRVTFCAGNAVVQAAMSMRNQILEVASRMLETPVHELDIANKSVFLKKSDKSSIPFSKIADFSMRKLNQPIMGSGFFDQGTSQADRVTGCGYESPAMIFATQIAEVEVDLDTGQVKVLHFTSAHDIGRVINPLLAEGQVEGGVVQGLGWTLMEDTVFKGGKLMTTDLTDYKIFTSMDSVPIETLWVETQDPNGPFGAKGFSEAANIPTAAAVANAIYDALGVRFNHLPITPEKIVLKLKKMKLR